MIDGNSYALKRYEDRNDLVEIAIEDISQTVKPLLEELEKHYEIYHIAELKEDDSEIDRMYSIMEDVIMSIHDHDNEYEDIDMTEEISEWIKAVTDENFN